MVEMSGRKRRWQVDNSSSIGGWEGVDEREPGTMK